MHTLSRVAKIEVSIRVSVASVEAVIVQVAGGRAYQTREKSNKNKIRTKRYKEDKKIVIKIIQELEDKRKDKKIAIKIIIELKNKQRGAQIVNAYHVKTKNKK
jgi:hypothetical protein